MTELTVRQKALIWSDIDFSFVQLDFCKLALKNKEFSMVLTYIRSISSDITKLEHKINGDMHI